MKISVIGTGMYSLALAKELALKDNEIWLWTENKEIAQEFNKTHLLKSIYNTDIPKNINVTDSLELALENCKIIFIACASKYVDIVCQNIEPYYHKNMAICIATKGIEESSEEFLSNIVKRKLLTNNISVISGPTFAIDMFNNNPVALAIASLNKHNEKIIIKALSNDNLKLKPCKDIIGIQICGAIKNCFAIASGIIKGLNYSESTQAFLINEALQDMEKIIYYMGGNPKTILTYAGIGDLMLTCTSEKSRNFQFGYIIGKTKNSQKIKEFLANNTVEGYYTLDVVYKILNHKGINLPLINIIYDIVYNAENPNMLPKFLIEKK